jgi:ATP-binding protein involved in chromosome partitioning
MSLHKDQILKVLSEVKHPESRKDIVELGMVENLKLEQGKVSFILKTLKARDPFAASLKKTAEAAIKKLDEKTEVIITIFTPPQIDFKPGDPLAKVKNIIAVASGKGGVGKSTVAVNLAVAMAKTGASVGLIDADVYGPSAPIMFGLEGQRPAIKKEGEKEIIVPIEKYGVKVVSIGFFVRPEDALVWRGPMATNALKQLITQSDWGELDYLFVDLPPGTGDIHLTMVQETAVTGAVIVSTPQQVALADAVKGIAMFAGEKINVPVLGLIENMSWFTPEELPDNKYYIFGKEGVKKLAVEMNVDLLGQIPLVQGIREDGDEGRPSVLDDNNPAAHAFDELAANLKAAIEKRNRELDPTKRVRITH